MTPTTALLFADCAAVHARCPPRPSSTACSLGGTRLPRCVVTSTAAFCYEPCDGTPPGCSCRSFVKALHRFRSGLVYHAVDAVAVAADANGLVVGGWEDGPERHGALAQARKVSNKRLFVSPAVSTQLPRKNTTKMNMGCLAFVWVWTSTSVLPMDTRNTP